MKRTVALLLPLLCGIAGAGDPAAARVDPPVWANASAPGHDDARIEFNLGFRAARPNGLLRSVARQQKDLAVEYDDATAAVRSLSRHVGYLTGPRPGQDALSIATGYVLENAALLGLEEEDLVDPEVTDRVYSRLTGVTHVYLRQTHRGLPVHGAQLHLNVNREGRILSVNNSFLPRLSRHAAAIDPALDLGRAVELAAAHAGIALAAVPRQVGAPVGLAHTSTVEHRGISREPIRGRLMWLPIRAGLARLVWNFQIHTLDRQHVYDMTVDAADGRVWTRFDWVAADSYRVYARPAESPSHVSPAPPADGRTLVTDPAHLTASPFGWHDTNGEAGAEFTTTRGNNVHAYTDTDKNNVPDEGSSPSGGASLDFDFPISLDQAPSAYRPAAVTNVFYWNNVVHDIQYQYGFDEAAGNFQVNNHGKGGVGNDDVRAEAQDAAAINNANFFTPPDGFRPRMQMYVWTFPNPDRDGDIDSGLVIHEYGHGISNRLVGGPSNVNCLTNPQQPGEGLSDWWALAYTHEPGDTGEDPRGFGTYAFGQPPNGLGLRTQRYSTNPVVNSWTYASINGMAIPHGVGSVWAEAAWKVYWKLVDAHGFDPNLYNATGGAGNQRMMLYVNEGLKNTACSPTFTQVRDGLLQAASQLHGGEDVCRMWTAFAAFGLGADAVSGGANSTRPINGFSIPASCQVTNQPPLANAGPDESVATGTPVILDGSGSSDPDGGPGPLVYSWVQVQGPLVTLSNPIAVSTTFTPTQAGAYVFRLTVSDGADTASDDATINVTNQPPVANAGPDQNVAVHTVVVLSGSGSSDPDGGPSPLGYSWVQLSGPSVILSTPTSVSTGFTATETGAHVFQLTVSDGTDTATDDVIVNVINQPPVANAGPDQNAAAGTQVVLSGSGSSDPDGGPGPLAYSWVQLSGPSVTLSSPTSVSTTFTPTEAGVYVLRLTVFDGADIAADDMTVNVTNQPPVANAGPDQSVAADTQVVLSGSESSDPDGGPSPLTYSWLLLSGPSVTLTSPTSVSPTFTPTEAGAYVFRLTVSDGTDIAADDVTVDVTSAGGEGGQTAVFDPAPTRLSTRRPQIR